MSLSLTLTGAVILAVLAYMLGILEGRGERMLTRAGAFAVTGAIGLGIVLVAVGGAL